MMWTYCFLAFIVFLILLIIYLFRHKRKKNISKPLRIIVWGTGILTLVLLAVSCFLPEDTQSNKISQKEQTEFFRISTAINNGKFDHILSDIDTLFPPTKNLDSTRQDNRTDWTNFNNKRGSALRGCFLSFYYCTASPLIMLFTGSSSLSISGLFLASLINSFAFLVSPIFL